jgi:hypothetical protein
MNRCSYCHHTQALQKVSRWTVEEDRREERKVQQTSFCSLFDTTVKSSESANVELALCCFRHLGFFIQIVLYVESVDGRGTFAKLVSDVSDTLSLASFQGYFRVILVCVL